MAEMDGSTLLRHLRRDHPDLPIVMVTAVGDVSTALHSLRNGAYDYLLKPFQREQLLAMVRRGLDHSRLRLENRITSRISKALVAARTRTTAIPPCRSLSAPTTSPSKLSAMLSTSKTQRPKATPSASPRSPSRSPVLPGMEPDAIRVVARAAFLHDIGKMAIPDAILRKPGALMPHRDRSSCANTAIAAI